VGFKNLWGALENLLRKGGEKSPLKNPDFIEG